MFMIGTALEPLRATGTKLAMALSLDHSMWFHTDRFRMDEWVLFETECPAAGLLPYMFWLTLYGSLKEIFFEIVNSIKIGSVFSIIP